MIDILMTVYNGEQYVVPQIESILNQTDSNWKLFIQDDCSTDRTVELIEPYVRRYPERITLLRNEKNSGSAQKNFFSMLPLVEHSYCMFCDHDDVWKPRKVEMTVRRMMELFAMAGALRTVSTQPQALAELRRILDDFPAAYEKGDSAAEDVEFRFHSKYVSLCGNKQLLELYKANWCVAAIFYFFFRTNQPAHHREKTLQHHVQMVEALAAGDELMLSTAIQTHINSCYDLLDLYRAFNSK